MADLLVRKKGGDEFEALDTWATEQGARQPAFTLPAATPMLRSRANQSPCACRGTGLVEKDDYSDYYDSIISAWRASEEYRDFVRFHRLYGRKLPVS